MMEKAVFFCTLVAVKQNFLLNISGDSKFHNPNLHE